MERACVSMCAVHTLSKNIERCAGQPSINIDNSTSIRSCVDDVYPLGTQLPIVAWSAIAEVKAGGTHGFCAGF